MAEVVPGSANVLRGLSIAVEYHNIPSTSRSSSAVTYHQRCRPEARCPVHDPARSTRPNVFDNPQINSPLPAYDQRPSSPSQNPAQPFSALDTLAHSSSAEGGPGHLLSPPLVRLHLEVNIRLARMIQHHAGPLWHPLLRICLIRNSIVYKLFVLGRISLLNIAISETRADVHYGG